LPIIVALPIMRYILLGVVVGAATGLIIGWLIWA
jgi:hypothetical protein